MLKNTQGRPFNNVGQQEDAATYERALVAAQQARSEMKETLPGIPSKIGISALVWFGLIYWFLIRR